MGPSENPDINYRIAVYGSLKAGYPNHGYLSNARFVGRFRTVPEYTMISLGRYPAIIPDGRTAIEVEVYEVDSEILSALDELEDHPDYYRRTLIKIADMDVFIYLLTKRRMRDIPKLSWRIIQSGRW